MEKLLFALEIENGWPPVASEGIWCEKVGEHYRLKNVPFFVPGIAFSDIFSADLDAVNEHIFDFQVIQRSGHRVIWLMNSDGIDISRFKKNIMDLGCRLGEIPEFSLGAVDVPPDVDFEKLDEMIDEYEEKGLDFAFPVWNDEAET